MSKKIHQSSFGKNAAIVKKLVIMPMLVIGMMILVELFNYEMTKSEISYKISTENYIKFNDIIAYTFFEDIPNAFTNELEPYSITYVFVRSALLPRYRQAGWLAHRSGVSWNTYFDAGWFVYAVGKVGSLNQDEEMLFAEQTNLRSGGFNRWVFMLAFVAVYYVVNVLVMVKRVKS